jgi:hypothetical protein
MLVIRVLPLLLLLLPLLLLLFTCSNIQDSLGC